MKWSDFRFGWRVLLREPGFSLVTVPGLALAATVALLATARYGAAALRLAPALALRE